MKAKRSVAALAVTGVAVVSVVAGIDLFSSPGSSSASEKVSGRAEMAVINSGKVLSGDATPSAAPKSTSSAADEAADAIRMRNQVELITAAQDAADVKMKAKNAALRRYEALAKADRSVQEERLRGRGDSEERIAQRLDRAVQEIARAEGLPFIHIVNDDLDRALKELEDVVAAARDAGRP